MLTNSEHARCPPLTAPTLPDASTLTPLILCVTLCYSNRLFYSSWKVTQDFVLPDQTDYTGILSNPPPAHTSHSSISSLHHFLVSSNFFGCICCMYAYLSPSHMVTSSSLPYIGRFRPHALRLVSMACVSLPSFCIMFPWNTFTHQWYMIKFACILLLPYFLYGWSRLFVSLEFHILIQGGSVILITRSGCEREDPIGLLPYRANDEHRGIPRLKNSTKFD